MGVFFGTLSGFFTVLGAVLGGIIVVLLALLAIVGGAFMGMIVACVAIALAYCIVYYWPRCAYYMLRDKEIPADPVAAWIERQTEAYGAWMRQMHKRMGEISERLKEEAAEERRRRQQSKLSCSAGC